MNDEEFEKWMAENIANFKKLSQTQQNLAVFKFVENVEPEVKFNLYNKLNTLLQKDVLSGLPRELQELICDQLDLQSLINCTRVCKEWNSIITSMHKLWKQKCSELGVAEPIQIPEIDINWFELCLQELNTYQNLCSGTAFKNQSIQSSANPATTLSYSGGFLAAANAKGVLMWNLNPLKYGSPPKFLQELIETQSSITSMKLCMEKGILVSGYGTGKIDVIEVKIFKAAAVGRILHEVKAHLECILALSVCPQYDIFASGSSDQHAKLWSLKTGELLHVFPIHPHWVIHVNLSTSSPDNIIMLTHTQPCLQVFTWNSRTGPSSMSHRTYQYDFPQPFITTAGCYIKEQSIYFVEQNWPSQMPHMAYLVIKEISGEEPKISKIAIKRKVRKLLGVGKRFALLLTSTSFKLQPELLVIDLFKQKVIGSHSVPHTCSSTPDQAQIVIGDNKWLDGLGVQEAGDLVIAVALRTGDIDALIWADLQLTTG